MEFITSLLKEHYPEDFRPAWATSNLSEATALFHNMSSTFSGPLEGIITGTQDSGVGTYNGDKTRMRIIVQVVVLRVWRL